MPENSRPDEPPKIYVKSATGDQEYILGQVYITAEGVNFIVDRQGAIHRLSPPTEPPTKEGSRKRTNAFTEPETPETAPVTTPKSSLTRDVHHAIVHRLGEMAKVLAGSPLGEEASQLHGILLALNQRIFNAGPNEWTGGLPAPNGGVETGTQTSRTPSPTLGGTVSTTETTAITPVTGIPTIKTVDQRSPCPKCSHAEDDSSMEVDPQCTSMKKKQRQKTPRAAKSGHAGSEPNKLSKTAASTPNADAPWSEVVGRKARKSGKAAAPTVDGEANFPALPPTSPAPRRLPPLRNAVIIVKVPSGSTYEDTVKVIQGSGVNPDDFGATVNGIRKTRGGDVVLDLGRSLKSREAASPLQMALSEKVTGLQASVAKAGTCVDMEVIDIESTSTAEAVLEAVKSAILAASKGDAAIEAATRQISVTSMWRLINGQQVAKVSVPRVAKPTEVTRVRVGWTSCRFRPRRPDAIRCYKCHGFGHSQSTCAGPDLSDSCRKCGEKSHKEKDCTRDSKCVACDRAGLKSGPHRPGSAACRARCAAESWRSGNRRND